MSRPSCARRRSCRSPRTGSTAASSQSDPAWAIGYALRGGDRKAFAAYLNRLSPHEIAELRLGKKTDAAYKQAEKLHRQHDRHAYGPPTIRFEETEVDQARAAGVLIEFEHERPDRHRHALSPRARQAGHRPHPRSSCKPPPSEQTTAKAAAQGKQQRSPQAKLDAEHRATVRSLQARAHGTNLDLGAALLQKLAVVDPADMDVARFFAYGLLGPDTRGYLGTGDHTVATIAANGIRLVFEEHRTTTTPVLKSGEPGKTKVAYGEVEDAAEWLWKFVEGARTPVRSTAECSSCSPRSIRTDLVLSGQQAPRPGPTDASRKDIARKAFERMTKRCCPPRTRNCSAHWSARHAPTPNRQDELQDATWQNALTEQASNTPDTEDEEPLKIRTSRNFYRSSARP